MQRTLVFRNKDFKGTPEKPLKAPMASPKIPGAAPAAPSAPQTPQASPSTPTDAVPTSPKPQRPNQEPKAGDDDEFSKGQLLFQKLVGVCKEILILCRQIR
jgi:hypothetical protein